MVLILKHIMRFFQNYLKQSFEKILELINTKQTENHDIINKLFEILPSEFIALINDINIDISQSFDLLTENYKLSQKMATIKNQLVEDDILKEDCK